MMNPEQREQARLTLLRVLAANQFKWGLPVAYLQTAMAHAAMPLTQAEIEAEAQYLVDKGMVEQITKLVSPENRTWRITATGRDYLAECGIE